MSWVQQLRKAPNSFEATDEFGFHFKSRKISPYANKKKKLNSLKAGDNDNEVMYYNGILK